MENISLENKINSNHKDRSVKVSFYITYAFLLTTATVTFIEAITNKDPGIRHILNLETCISVVAAFFYTTFMKKIKDMEHNQKTLDNNQNKKELNYKDINLTRYTDWAITTPIMLLVLCLVFGYNNKTVMKASYFLIILIINYAMLLLGYLGEVGYMKKRLAQIGGFISFFILYGLIYYSFLHKKYMFDNQIIFWAFVIFWAFYGVLYNMKEETKNIGYNILDLFSKCFVGLFFWAYLTKVIRIF